MTLEKAGDIAQEAVKQLGGTPLVLGLVLINAMFIGAMFWSDHQQTQRKDELLARLASECLKKP